MSKYDRINNKFIDVFYTFYNEGKNEYDFTINLDNIAELLVVPHLQIQMMAYC